MDRSLDPADGIPRGLLRCPAHPGHGFVMSADETQTRVLGDLWLSRQPAARITYQCGLAVRVEWPTQWNEAHPEYRLWGPNPLGGSRG